MLLSPGTTKLFMCHRNTLRKRIFNNMGPTQPPNLHLGYTRDNQTTCNLQTIQPVAHCEVVPKLEEPFDTAYFPLLKDC